MIPRKILGVLPSVSLTPYLKSFLRAVPGFPSGPHAEFEPPARLCWGGTGPGTGAFPRSGEDEVCGPRGGLFAARHPAPSAPARSLSRVLSGLSSTVHIRRLRETLFTGLQFAHTRANPYRGQALCVPLRRL